MTPRDRLALVASAAVAGLLAAADSPLRAAKPTPPAKAHVAAKARRLLDKAVGAFGGRSVLQSVKGLRIQSTGTRALQPGPDSAIDVSSDTLMVFPDRYRQELTTPAGVATTIVRGPRGYVKVENVYNALDAAQFKALTDALGRNPVALLKRYLAETLAVAVAGSGSHEGTPVTRLALADGSEVTIDPATGFVLGVRYGGVFGGKAGTYAIAYDAYRATEGGLVYPHQAVATFDGEIAYTSRIERIVVNPAFEDGVDFLTPYGLPPPGSPPERR